MQGYLDDARATAETIDSDGWMHTGDIGILDAKGYLRITDRLKDMYIAGGFNCYPAEIERIIAGHPAVAQVAVVGVPDERMGEVGCAYVVPTPDAAGADPVALGRSILSWSRGAMANYKVPRGVVLVDSLPVNASGKVLKRELRQRHADGVDHMVTNKS
jgi:acyl-CoA synthetase (AMP-forming)/AMP-acid ligase II